MDPTSQNTDDQLDPSSYEPLFLATLMFAIAYQVWARRPGASSGLARKAVVLYTLVLGITELSRVFVYFHPFFHLVRNFLDHFSQGC